MLKAVQSVEMALEQGGLFLVELPDGGHQGVLELVVGPDQDVLAVPDRLEGPRQIVVFRILGECRGHDQSERRDGAGRISPGRRRGSKTRVMLRMELHQELTLAQPQVISMTQRGDQGGRLALDRQAGTGEVDEEAPPGGSDEDGMDPGDGLSFDPERTGPASSQERQFRKHRGRLIGVILGP
jgi:hypothetical protein